MAILSTGIDLLDIIQPVVHGQGILKSDDGHLWTSVGEQQRNFGSSNYLHYDAGSF